MSYDPALPTTRDRVRALIGDTTTPELFPDATYDAIIAVETGVYAAASRIARMLAAQYARMVDQEVGQVSARYSQLFDHYSALADHMAAAVGSSADGAPVPYFGGVVTSEKDALEDDDTLEKPYFTKDMQKNNDAASQTDDDDDDDD